MASEYLKQFFSLNILFFFGGGGGGGNADKFLSLNYYFYQE